MKNKKPTKKRKTKPGPVEERLIIKDPGAALASLFKAPQVKPKPDKSV